MKLVHKTCKLALFVHPAYIHLYMQVLGKNAKLYKLALAVLPEKNPWQQMVVPQLDQPGYMCFHSTNKIYNPLTLLRPHFHTSALTGGWRWWWWESNWKSMHQFYSKKRGKMRGQKSTNLPKLAKCLEWKQRRREMTDWAQRWAWLDGHRCTPARSKDKGSRTEKKKTETDQQAVCVVGVSLNRDKNKKWKTQS